MRLAFMFLEGLNVPVELVEDPCPRRPRFLVNDVGERARLVCANAVQGLRHKAVERCLLARQELEADYQRERLRNATGHAGRLPVAIGLKFAADRRPPARRKFLYVFKSAGFAGAAAPASCLRLGGAARGVPSSETTEPPTEAGVSAHSIQEYAVPPPCLQLGQPDHCVSLTRLPVR